jgi:AraC-like DNA-binding protein
VGQLVKTGFGDKLHSPAKIAAIVEALTAEGIAPDQALRGVNLRKDELYAPATRVSLNQMIEACRNASRLSRDPQIAFRAGAALHVSAYGMYGYAMLCCTDFRRAMAVACKYQQLAMPLMNIAFEEKDEWAIWTITPVAHSRVDAALYRFLVELHLGIDCSLHRDVMGPSFKPSRIDLAYNASERQLLPELAGCPIFFGQPANHLVFERVRLDAKPMLGHRMTQAAVLAMCDDLLVEMVQRGGVAGRVRDLLLRDIANRPSFESVAKLMRTNPRTLRRQLKAQETSFRQLVDELRMQLAIKYLRDTKLTTEDIALVLGFSDAANFRHAFRRWTQESPSQFKHLAIDYSPPDGQ